MRNGSVRPGQAYNDAQRRMEKEDYDLFVWAVYLNHCKRYSYLKGLSFEEKMAIVRQEMEKERPCVLQREGVVRCVLRGLPCKH